MRADHYDQPDQSLRAATGVAHRHQRIHGERLIALDERTVALPRAQHARCTATAAALAGVLADALIAAAATGRVADLERPRAPGSGLAPRPARSLPSRGYQAPLAAYRALCDQVVPIFERLAGVSGGAAGA